MRTRSKWLLILALTVAVVAPVACGPIMSSNVKEPEYSVIESGPDSIEIRRYPAIIVAETKVSGERYAAINDGFRTLADYIFGNNTSKSKVAMTAPVMQQAGESIAMTAPVSQQVAGEGWIVRFVMPAEYTMETLPKPNSSAVTLVEVPAKQFAAIRFSGFSSDANLDRHRETLMRYVASRKLTTAGEPVMAFYNPPWTLPFMRRNEILIELR